jgi:hypothetical protein
MSTEPINIEPRRMGPPFDLPQTAFGHLRVTDTASWRGLCP